MIHVQAKIDDGTYHRFRRLFPMQGAVQWFIASCFDAVLDLSERGEVETPVDLVEVTVKEVAEST